MENDVMFKLTYGLFVATACHGEKHNGCIINTVIQVTAEPNQICIAINKGNLTHDLIMKDKRVNISIISENADFELFKRFGFQSGRDVDKFAGCTGFKRAANDVYYITEGTNAYISAWVKQTVDLGSHTLFIASVVNAVNLSDVPSATYEYYHNHMKPKPEAVSPENAGKTIYRCKVCGYEYVGGELPEDFICPICKHPAGDFEKVSG